MRTISRSAGAALLVYGLGVTAAFMAAGAPGGDYQPAGVAGYVSAAHWPAAWSLSYLGALAALALLVFGHGVRSALGGLLGEAAWGLSVAATTISVTGAFVTGGLDVAMAEGGTSVMAGVPYPVVYTITEIGNLLSVCGPAFFVGVLAIVLAVRSSMPLWLRIVSVPAGVLGITAPLYFTYFGFVAWTVVAGVTVLASRAVPATAHVQPSLV